VLCTLNTIQELIQPWPQRLQAQQQLQLQLPGVVLLHQMQLQYLQVTLLPLREPRLQLLVAQPPQLQLQSLLMVLPQQQLRRLRQLQVLPLLLLPPLILEHLQQRPQPQQQRLQVHLLQTSLQQRPQRQKVLRQPLQLQQLLKGEIYLIFIYYGLFPTRIYDV
jgi:hypothetical protein